jgi:hypothetical protein
METQAPGKEAGRGGHQPIVIIVNTKEKVVPDELVKFQQLLELAFQPVPTGPYIEFLVTYDGAVSQPHAGTMSPGQEVRVSRSHNHLTVFDVIYTDKS